MMTIYTPSTGSTGGFLLRCAHSKSQCCEIHGIIDSLDFNAYRSIEVIKANKSPIEKSPNRAIGGDIYS